MKRRKFFFLTTSAATGLALAPSCYGSEAMNTASGWADVQFNGGKILPELFCGYTKNMGAGELIEDLLIFNK